MQTDEDLCDRPGWNNYPVRVLQVDVTQVARGAISGRPGSEDNVEFGVFKCPASLGCVCSPTEGQHYRMAGLNMLAATIIYWNTKHLGMAVTARKRASLDCSPDLLAHISPLGWAHILLTGEYRWKNR